MQLLAFSIGSEDYAIESRRVVEVLPLIPARPIARQPEFVRGTIVYRGRFVPLIDLGRLLTDTPLRERLSTRVIVVDVPGDTHGHRIRLGLAAEKVVSFCSEEEAEAAPTPAWPTVQPSPGRLLRLGGRTLHWLDPDHLVPSEVLTTLAILTEASIGDDPES